LLIMGSLVLLSAAALGISLTLRWLRAPGPRGSHEHVYARAPLPPQREESLPQAAALPPPVPEPRDVETPPALAPIAVAAADATTHAEPAPRAAKRTREVGAGAEPRAARQNASVRVTATSAKVHLGNDVKAQVVCSLPRGTVRPVLAELPGTEARWFAVRCDAGAVGWVHESDLAPLAR
jgi:hypothetical protein